MPRGGLLRGTLLLLGTTVLWGTSFPGIKYVVSRVDPITYVWVRSLIAALGLSPYMAYAVLRRGPKSLAASIRGGLITGVVFAVGLWLQGWGTHYTTASNSAFITGLNVVFVHLYAALVERAYTPRLGAALGLALAGLYLLTRPTGGFGVGEALVLLGAVMWASQVVLVSRYAPGSDPLAFTFAEMLPSIAFAAPSLALGGPETIDARTLAVLAYLGLVCADAAFILQVAGQRSVPPAVAAIIFLLEPVFAAVFAAASLGERFEGAQYAGMILILSAMLVAEASPETPSRRGGRT